MTLHKKKTENGYASCSNEHENVDVVIKRLHGVSLVPGYNVTIKQRGKSGAYMRVAVCSLMMLMMLDSAQKARIIIECGRARAYSLISRSVFKDHAAKLKTAYTTWKGYT